MKSQIVGLVIFTLAIAGCKSKGSKSEGKRIGYHQVITINEGFTNRKNLPLSEVAADIEYVKLEFTKKSSINQIRNIFITDKYIFISSNGLPYVMQFSRDGQFIRQVGTIGKGPGEYLLCRGFTVDEENELILIYDNWTYKILCYSFSGEYKKTIETNNDLIRNFMVAQNGEIICQSAPIRIQQTYFMLLSLNEKGDTIFLKKSWYFRNFNGTYFGGPDNIFVHNDSIYVREYFNDTIYLYNNKSLEPSYILQWDKYKDPRIFSFQNLGIKRILDNNSKVFELTLIQSSSSYLYLYYNYHYKNYLGRFDKLTGDVLFTEQKQGCLVNDFDGGLSVNPSFNAPNRWIAELPADSLLDTLTPEYFAKSPAKYPNKKEKLKDLVDSLDENDNPVIMIITLK
jgi:hypothetical protein